MRYEVNQELFVIHFDYASLRNQESKFQAADFMLPFLWGNKEIPAEVDLEMLTVTDHFLTAWDQDPDQEKKYDGYLLLDSKGEIFANQYPLASYGQISDTGDRRFNYYVTEGEDHGAIFKAFDMGEKKVYEYHLLADVIRNMTEGLNNAKEKLSDIHLNEFTHEDAAFYTELRDNLTIVLEMIEKAFKEKYPEWSYEIKKKNISGNPDRPFYIERCVFTKK